MTVQSRILRSFVRGETFLDFGRPSADLGDQVAAARLSFDIGPVTEPQDTQAGAASGDPSERLPSPIFVPTNLTPAAGVAIVAYATDPIGADGDDIIRFVILSAIGSSTQIFFTDRNWSGTAFAAASAGEGTFTYSAGADLPAGTVITITSAQLLAAGMDLSNNGETIYVYQGTDANTPTTFLYAIDVGDDNNVFEAGELTGTGLTAGTNAVAVGFDQASYAGQSTQIAQTQLAKISSSIQWHGHSGDDIPGTIYDDRADVTLSGPLTNPDMQLFGMMSGGGQSDAFIRIDNEEASNVGTNLTRLFRDNPNFNHLTDLAFDIEDGVWFAVDSDGVATTRILKGNIADLVSGTSNPTISVIYDFPNDDDNVPVDDDSFIGGIEIDTANNRIYFVQGDIINGHGLRAVGYNGGAVTDYGLVNFALDNSLGIFHGGIFDFALDVPHNTAYLTYTIANTINNPPTAEINYIVKVNSLSNPAGGYSVVPINGSDDPPGANPANHFPDVEGSLAGIDIDIANQRLYFVTQRLGGNGTAGIFMLDLVTHNYVELWQQQSNFSTNTLLPFPTTQMEYIEVDTIGGRYYVSTLNSSDTAVGHDGTVGDEGGSRIFSGALATTAGQPAPTPFASVFENTANGAVLGMEIDYAPTLTLTGAGSTYTESTNLPASPAGPTVDVATSPAVNDADQAIIQGATVAITTGFFSGDTLSFTAAGTITGSYNATNGVLTLTGNATFAQYQAALDSVRFTNAGDNPTNYGANQSRTVTFTVFDGLLNSDPATATITVVGINDAPVNTVGAAATVNEDSSANAIAGVSVFDVDANPATQDIVVTLSVAHGTITVLTNVTGGIIAADITGGTNGSATITITATQNQINATLAAANGLLYTPTGNYNGADALTVTPNDQGFSGTDPGLTGTIGSEQDQDAKVINITPINDAPTVVDATQTAATILEDTPSTLGETVSSLFTASFSDALDQQQTGGNMSGSVANTLAGIAVVGGSTSASGSWQYFNGATFVNIGAASTASAVLISAGTAIRFFPTLNFNGSPPDLVVHLVDSSGAAITNGATVNLTGATGGTTRYSTATVALSESVTAVNDAPVNTVGGTLTVAEDSGATAVTGLSISDVDANPATDVFTVTLDVLHGTLNVLTGVPGGVGAGNVAGNGGATVTLTGTINQINATLAAAGGVTYTPTGNYNGADRVQITTDDGGATGLDPGATGAAGTEADTDSKTINVTAVNDPVTTAAPPTLTVNEDATNVAVAGLSISDVDAALAPAGVYVVTLSSTNGTMTLTTTTGLTFSAGDGASDATMTFRGTLADLNAALATATYTPTANYNGSATITLSATDIFGGIVATGTGAATNDSDVVNVTVTGVNDPVTTTAPPTLTLNEDATNVAVAGLSISDIDATLAPAGVYQVTLSSTNGTLTLTTTAGLTFDVGDGAGDATMTFHGTLAAINTALATANYTPTANYNGPATITLSATDIFGGIVATGTGAATSDSDVINVTVTAQNDTPVVAVAASVSATEQVAGTIDAAATITDLELGGLGNYAGSALTVGRNGGAQPEDLLTFGASGAFTVNGANLESGGLVFATFAGGNGTPLVITFTGSGTPATQALVNAVVQSLQYTYTGDNPPASIVMNYSFNDGAPANAGQGGGGSPIGTDAITINITDTPENAAPTLDLDGDGAGTGYTASFTEGGAAVLITDVDVVIADVDAGDMIEGATITINGPVAGDLLTLGAQVGFTITGSGTGTITIIGTGTADQYEAMLAQITFSNTSEDPGATRTIDITVTDGAMNSNIAVATINITEINDEPTLAATAVNPTFTEGGAQVDLFSGVTADTIEAGQTFVSLTLTVTNVTDGANEILVVDGVNVALTNGNVVATGSGNVTVTLAAGTATVVVGPSTLSEAALQTLIDGLAYLNTSENPTDADRVVTITQLVDSGSDTSPNDATLAPGIASTVNVNPVNDTPINTVPGTQTINEDASVTLSTGNGNAIQVADADATTLTVTLTVLHGTLTLASSAGLSFGAGDGSADTTMTFSGTAAQINAALGSGLTYSPNANFNGSDSIAVFTTDNGQSGGAAQTDSDSVAVNITAINDAPVVIGDGTESATTINEDTPGPGQTIQALFAGQYSDAADNQIPNGGASSPGQFSGVAVTANGSSASTGQWQYFSGGVWTDIGAASDAAAKLLGDPFVTLIRFNPAADYNGPAPTLTVHLIDNSLPFGIVNGMVVDLSGPGATGGTTAYSTGTVVLSQDITAVNDAPLNTVPGTQTINEDASVTLSTGNGNAIQVADVDATTVTVTLTVLHGTLTLASNAGLSFGAGDGMADTTMTFSGTAAQINAALASGLTYNPNANFNGSDSISVLTTDNGQTGSGGTLQDNDSITVNITAINDAPVVIGDGTESATTINEDTPGPGQTIQALFAGQYSDAADNQIPNGGASSPGQFSGVAVTANGSSGATGQWQYFSGGVWTDIGAASDAAAKLLGDPFVTLIRFNPAANYNGPAPTLTVHLIDNSLPFGIVNGMVVDLSGPGATGGTTAYSTGTVVLSQDITAVNDAPLNTVPGAQTINEDGLLTFSSGNGNMISVSDVDAGGGTITTTLDIASGALFPLPFGPGGPTVTGAGTNHVVISGTVAQVNGVLNTLIYQPAANANGPFALTVVTTDNGNSGSGGTLQDNDTINITVNSVNDAPSGADKILTGSEDDPLVLTAADFGFTDPVEGNAFLAVIIDTFPANGTLFLDVDGPGGNPPVNLSTLGPGVFVSVSDINLGRLYFQPDADEFGTGYAQFTFRVQDDGGMLNGGVDRDPVANTIFINITPDNLPPAVDLNGAAAGVNYTTTFAEDGAAVAIGSGVIVSDPDSGLGDLIESATITLTDRVAGDSLTLTGALPAGITAVTTPSVGAITITITGPGTGAQYQALIQSILYATTNQDPTVGGTDTARTITVTVNDGAADSAVATTTVNITPSDDAPVAQPDLFTITESQTIVAGNLFANNGSGADSDPDGPPLSIAAVGGGPGANVGAQFTLDSGALLTVHANGTFDYDPNGIFLRTPTPGSGASNTPSHDSFTYTLSGGNMVTVSITLTGLDTDDLLLGTAGADILMAGMGNDELIGGLGSDLLYGESGNDSLTGGADNDLIDGGAGIDTAYIAGSLTYIDTGLGWIVQSGEGNDNLNGVEIVVDGGGQRNLLVRATGYGTLQAALTDAQAGDNVRLATGNYSGMANYSVGGLTVIAQPNAVQNLTYATASAFGITVYAANGADTITGSANDDNLHGGVGSDTLNGGAGNDKLYGDAGADAMTGGNGDDWYFVDNAGDTAIEASGGGNDRLFASVSYTLAAGSEIELLTTDFHAGTTAVNLTGNELANTIYGNAGDNQLNGGAGADTMVGSGGNDWFFVDNAGDRTFEALGDGNDRVFASTSYTLIAGAEVELLTTDYHAGTAAIDLTGNALANTIYGNAGDNKLNGGVGADTMVGSGGNDWFFVDNAGDRTFEAVGDGNDRVFASTSYTLQAGAEVELLSTDFHAGTGAIDLTGNELANTIYGNAGSNVIDGKGGNDGLVGNGGADTFAFTTALGAGNVDYVFDFTPGNDKIALDDAVFTGLGLGSLSAGAFVTGPAALDADDRIIYNGGQLYFDADGNGAGAAILFATLQGAPVLTASDFTVI